MPDPADPCPSDYAESVDIQVSADIRATPEHLWTCLVERIGEWMVQFPTGADLALRLEAFPGGRLYRHAGEGRGQWWANVQVILPPDVLELHGPLFFSAPNLSHVAFRIEPADAPGLSRLTVRHRAIGPTEGLAPNADRAWRWLIGERLTPIAETSGKPESARECR